MFGKKKSKINWKKVGKAFNEVAEYATMAMNTIAIVEGCHSIYKTFRRVTTKKVANAEAAPAEEAKVDAQAVPAQA